MKNLISVFALISVFSNVALALGQDSQIDCDLNYKDLQRVVIKTGRPGSVKLQFYNGELENLRPVKGVGGEFGEIVFPDEVEDKIPREKSFVQVMSSRLGEIRIAFICKASTITCDTMGDGFALQTIATFRINDELIKMNGHSNPLCQRTVLH